MTGQEGPSVRSSTERRGRKEGPERKIERGQKGLASREAARSSVSVGPD